MGLFAILLPLAGALGIAVIAREMPNRRRIAVVGIAAGLFFFGIAVGIEVGRIQAHYEDTPHPSTHHAVGDEGSGRSERRPDVVRVLRVDDPGLPLEDRERTALRDAGMTRVSMPFGVLLAADRRMPAD